MWQAYLDRPLSAQLIGLLAGFLLGYFGDTLWHFIRDTAYPAFTRWRAGRRTHDWKIDRPCGACAHCGYTGQVEWKKRPFFFGERATVRQYFYCGLTGQELPRERAFFESRCAHWEMCAQLEATRKEKNR